MNDGSRAKKMILWIIAIALFMEALDITIINTAIPKMADSLLVDPLNLKFALTSYLLSLALFIPVSGWVADKWGTQRTFIFALAVFTLSSIACGRSMTLSELVIARVFQGLGGAFMMPVGRLIILRTFLKSERIRTMNFIAMPALFGPLLGPFLGGFITSYYSWPWIFYVNVPIGLLGILFALRYIENSKSESLRSLDKKGFVLFGLSLAGIFFSFEAISLPFINTSVLVFISLCSALGFLLFYRHYKKTPEPVLNFKLFSIRTFCIAGMGNVWIRVGTSGITFILPLLFQLGYGTSPLKSGLLTCGMALGAISGRSINRALLRRWGFRKMLTITSLLMGICILSFSLVGELNIPLIVSLVFVSGMVASLQFSVSSVLSYADVNQEEMSHATSISSTLQQLSASVGITLSVLILQLFIGWRHPLVANHPAPFRYTFLVMGVLVSLSAFLFLKLKPTDGEGLTDTQVT